MEELLNCLKVGDSVLITYDKDWKELATVFAINNNRILFNNIEGKFEFTRSYLLKSDIKIQLIENY
ncbi:MAG: hypothetical protein E7I48_18555 [Clostridium celatum]|jgi:hypothetical protein|nr:hypothetical protein [Clostridium celatum]